VAIVTVGVVVVGSGSQLYVEVMHGDPFLVVKYKL